MWDWISFEWGLAAGLAIMATIALMIAFMFSD
jgi:hypothetical protein